MRDPGNEVALNLVFFSSFYFLSFLQVVIVIILHAVGTIMAKNKIIAVPFFEN